MWVGTGPARHSLGVDVDPRPPPATPFGYDIDRSLTTVPGAWNIVIHARNLESTMSLTGTPVQRDPLDLAVTTLYHPSSLGAWFPSQGFEVVWEGRRDGTSFFLLRCG